MTSLLCKLKWITCKYFKLILKKTQFWLQTYGNQKATVLGDWFGNFLMRTGNEEELIMLRKAHKTGLLDLLTGSGRPRTFRSCVVQHGAVADWWYSRTMASTRMSLCLSQRRTFWTYVMTINLFSLYLMNFMLHTTLDATGVVLRVHYNSIKSDVFIFTR